MTDASGLPCDALMERMTAFENAVFEELERDLLAILVSVAVCNGVKEWCAYIGDAQLACDRLSPVLEPHERFPVELTVEDDASWELYTEMLRSLRPPEGED